MMSLRDGPRHRGGTRTGGGVAGLLVRRVQAAILAIATLFALAVLGMGGFFLSQERGAAIARAEGGTRDLARMLEEYARRTFETADLVTELAMREMPPGGMARLRHDDVFFRHLRDLATRNNGSHVLVVDGTGGAVATSARFGVAPLDLSDRAWFRAHLAGADRHVGHALFSRITQEMLFTFSRRLGPPGDAMEGVVQVSVRLGFFDDAARNSEMGPNLVFSMYDQRGNIVARTGLGPDGVGRDIRGTPHFEATQRAPAGTIHAALPRDGRMRIISWRQVEGWPVVVTASVPLADALAPYYATRFWAGSVLAAVLAALAALTWLALRQAAQEGAAQRSLAGANAALRDAAETLERRVEERTAALATANAALAEGEARFRGIFNSTFQFIGLLGPDGTLLEANDTALAFAGLTREEVVGRPFRDTRWWDMGEETLERLDDAIARAAAGEPQRYEVAVRGAGERVASIDFFIRPVRDAEGRVAMLVAEGHDLTELKLAESRLREAQKLEMLGQLTGGVAHDFNNLLMAVLGNLALLRKRLPEDARLVRLLDGATQGAERGAALTQRLLAFARRQELKPQPVDLAALVRGMQDLMERSVGPRVRIETSLPDGLPPALADSNQTELALLNLAINARDAMPQGGRLRIALSAMRAPGRDAPVELPPAAYLRLVVRDEGTGMDEATLRRATEPFFTTKGAGRGSGLGLPMVQGFAQQSGGTLRLRSRPGEGTEAEVWLPASAEAATAPAGTTLVTPVPAGRPRRVLLVDDDGLVLAGTAAMLEDLGHVVVTARSGPEALALLDRDMAVQAVVTDHAMPGMTGLDLAREIRLRRPDLPVVLATGYAELPAAATAGLPRLNKPYRQQELAEVLATLRDEVA